VIRFLVRTGIMLAANAVGLIVAAILFSGFHLSASGFIIAVVIFTVSVALLGPFLASQFRRRNSAALGGVSLVATLLALIITDLVSDGLSISGLAGWLGGTVVVWAASLLAVFLLPYLGLKKYLEERKS
jgi:putative membrane protein